MTKIVQIGSTSYEIPDQGEKAGWGEDTTEYLVAIANALEDVQGPNDILTTSATLANNQSSTANIDGLLFNTGEVQHVEVEFLIIREYDSGSSVLVESGNIVGNYDGTDFYISQDSIGDSGVTITVSSAGQFLYTSSDLTNHVSSTIRYRAKTIDTP